MSIIIIDGIFLYDDCNIDNYYHNYHNSFFYFPRKWYSNTLKLFIILLSSTKKLNIKT